MPGLCVLVSQRRESAGGGPHRTKTLSALVRSHALRTHNVLSKFIALKYHLLPQVLHPSPFPSPLVLRLPCVSAKLCIATDTLRSALNNSYLGLGASVKITLLENNWRKREGPPRRTQCDRYRASAPPPSGEGASQLLQSAGCAAAAFNISSLENYANPLSGYPAYPHASSNTFIKVPVPSQACMSKAKTLF